MFFLGVVVEGEDWGEERFYMCLVVVCLLLLRWCGGGGSVVGCRGLWCLGVVFCGGGVGVLGLVICLDVV